MTTVDADVRTVETRTGDDAFAGLGPDWAQLYRSCSTATPFQSHAWLESWWDTYGRAGRLRLVLVRRDDRLVAAAPLMLAVRGGCPVLLPLGGPFADFTDVLVADDDGPGEAAATARCLAAGLVAVPRWQAIDLPETRPGATAATLLRTAWPGRSWQTPGSLCLELPAGPIDRLVAELPQHSRKTVKRRLNQLRKSTVDVTAVTADAAGPALAALLRLHAAQWDGRGGNREHFTSAFTAHLTRAVPPMIRAGQAALREYRFDGVLMASSLVLVGGDHAGGYLYGADPALRQRIDVTVMLLADTLPFAQELGRPMMSMLRGGEEHKLRWQPREALNRRLVLGRPGSVPATGYARAVRAYGDAVSVVKRRAPWLRRVRTWVRR